MDADQSRRFVDTMNSMSEHFAIQNATIHIPFFDGKNIPLKQFIQDVENGSSLLAPAQTATFLTAVKSRLRGMARECMEGAGNINTLEALTNRLKKYFAPGKKYTDYCTDLQNARMRREEDVTEFYLRVKKLQSSAQAALINEFGREHNENSPIVNRLAVDAFAKGLRDELRYAVTLNDPATLSDAYDLAIRMERQMRRPSEPPPTNYNARYFRDNSPSTTPYFNNYYRYDRSPSPYSRTLDYRYDRRDEVDPVPRGILKRDDRSRAVERDPRYFDRNRQYDQGYSPIRPSWGREVSPGRWENPGRRDMTPPKDLAYSDQRRNFSPGREFSNHPPSRNDDPNPRGQGRYSHVSNSPTNNSGNFQTAHRSSAPLSQEQSRERTIRFQDHPQKRMPESQNSTRAPPS